MKLDLKNSKWWNVGFNTEILQEHLTRILAQKKESAEFQNQKLEAETFIHQLPVEVRAAQEAQGLDQTSLLQELKFKQSEQKDSSYINRFKEPSELEVRGMMEQISPIMADYGEFAQSPQFVDIDQPLDMMHILEKMGQKDFSKQIYGEKTIDFGDFEDEVEPQ